MAPPQWAYQVENYVTEPDEELVCSICRAVFCDPTLCPCDHVFCKACITKWLQNNRNCPICRKRASIASIKQTVPIVKNLIMKLVLNCRNKTLGCKAQFSVENSEAHVKECEYELVQCKNKPCTDKLFRKDVVEHETKDCPHRAIRCKKCKCKIPSSVTEEHDCIVALRKLVKERSETILTKSKRIKQLRAEIKTLKAKIKDVSRPRMSSFSRGHPLNSDTLSSISPDEITINIQEFDSGSSTSSISLSSDSSDSFYIFTNEPLPDDNEESDSFSAYMDNEDTIENENTRDANEYRNAESQTIDPLSLSYQRNVNLAYENDSTNVEVPNSVCDESEEHVESRRPVKRRPTTQKPAKRRLPPLVISSDDSDDDYEHAQSSKHSWRALTSDKDKNNEADRGEAFNSYMEAGPSSASAPVRNSKATVSDCSKSKDRSHSKSKQKRAKQAGNCVRDNSVSSRVTLTSDNPVFERTLALLEQYNLESDPEWLPQYASHRGNDTTTESDSSYLTESSNSELSDVDSLENKSASLDSSQHELPVFSEFMNWICDSTSEDDPDYEPPEYDPNED